MTTTISRESVRESSRTTTTVKHSGTRSTGLGREQGSTLFFPRVRRREIYTNKNTEKLARFLQNCSETVQCRKAEFGLNRIATKRKKIKLKIAELNVFIVIILVTR